MPFSHQYTAVTLLSSAKIHLHHACRHCEQDSHDGMTVCGRESQLSAAIIGRKADVCLTCLSMFPGPLQPRLLRVPA